ncbi:MAG: PIN domain-containing protein [Candidatus Riflebacteria bacterium]|nr:PIN domain-containing protein [Candidatus Riflebacteria bacterium]
MRIFLDTCIWFMAIKNPHGIGGRTVDLGLNSGLYEIAISKQIAVETCRKLREKIDAQAVQAFNFTISRKGVGRFDLEEHDIREWQGVISKTDAHVLAGAQKAKADALVTFDEHFFTSIVKQRFPIRILKPKDFLDWLEDSQRRRKTDDR